MSYYKYNFISAEPLFARIELELSTYFSTGVVSSTLFPIWTKYVLDRLGKGSFPIQEGILVVDNYESRLPPDFISVREARMCTTSQGFKYKLPSYFYKSETYRVSEDNPDRCQECDDCDMCQKSINVVYKTTDEVLMGQFKTMHLLRPGNISCLSKCSSDSRNRNSGSEDTFDIHGNKFTTNFVSGEVYLTYYSSQLDEEGTPMIPDNARIIDAIEHYIKFKIFEMVLNQTSDETFNQVKWKYESYKNEFNKKFVSAESETKKETDDQIIHAIKKMKSRNNKYIIK